MQNCNAPSAALSRVRWGLKKRKNLEEGHIDNTKKKEKKKRLLEQKCIPEGGGETEKIRVWQQCEDWK